MNLHDHLLAAFQLKLLDASPLNTGFGVAGYKALVTEVGQIKPYTIAIKSRLNAPSSEFTLEARMLEDLRSAGWPMPKPLASDAHTLLMEWLETDGSPLSKNGEAELGQQLAQLHSQNTKSFGYDYSTRIGSLDQPNPHAESWVPFFREQRLDYMATKAHQENKLPLELFKRLQKFQKQLEEYLPEPGHPSLIHGDIWGGNIITNDNKLSGLIDPALYHAHPEIELAFTQMFSSLGQSFFEGYQTTTKIDPEFFSERIEIYNLYPTLVHVRLFGSSYLPPIEQCLTRFGF
ncbi:MAG: aminoglycoside phosphotransferase [Rhodomicrobium sp.]|nr:MAG: aminoglycoside phosphotransferase [Rhodomicrobium sp.]